MCALTSWNDITLCMINNGEFNKSVAYARTVLT